MTAKPQYKCLTFIAMLYITSWISTSILSSKLIVMPFGFVAASSILSSIGFLFDDLIAEVYGYEISRYIFWSAAAALVIFNLICHFFVALKSPPFWSGQASYNFVLNGTFYKEIFVILASVITWRINVYLLLKLKVVYANKYFLIRSLCCSLLTATIYIFLLLPFYFTFYSKYSLNLMAWSYCVRILGTIILIFPVTTIVYILKIIENIDNSKEFNFNPFRKNASSTTPSN